MPDHDNDIDALLILLSKRKTNGCYFDQRYHAALTALVAERDELKAECDKCFDFATIDLIAERDGLRHVLSTQIEVRDALVAERDALKQRVAELEANPPADRDRELRERLIESALQGAGCRLGIMTESDAEELGRQAVWIVNGAIAAMRKGEANGE